jgi:hypothetical protein
MSPAGAHTGVSPYDSRFFDTADRAAAMSADGVIAPLQAELRASSVVDIGCGRGVWLSRWMQHGVHDALGVDGAYVDQQRLSVPPACFMAHDLVKPLRLGRQFDVVQSLEVAEHLPEVCAESFIDTLVAHGRMILFSAAIPGQGGEHHVNEQPLDYWRTKFAARRYEVFDFVRPLIRDDRSVAFCYRYNVLLYVHNSVVEGLPAAIRASWVPAGTALFSPLSAWMKLRLAAVSCLPRAAVDQMARARYRLATLANLALGGGRS